MNANGLLFNLLTGMRVELPGTAVILHASYYFCQKCLYFECTTIEQTCSAT